MGIKTIGFVRIRARFWFYALLAVLCPLSPSWAEDADLHNPAESTVAANDGESEEEEADDLDSLLDMDLDSLSQAQVNVADSAPTFSDPIVEGISKTAEKASEAPGIVDVITAEEIEAYGAKNLYEVLERATSVFMTGSYMHRRNMASIRGNLAKHEDNHVLILINGRPFRESTLGGINWAVYTAFPIHAVQRIEVMRGPGSVLYGTNALTGVINIVTKKPVAAEEHASTLAGSDGFQRYQLASSHGTESHGLYVGATYLEQEGWPFSAVLEDSLRSTGPYGEENIGVFAQYHWNGFSANAFIADATQASLGALPVSSVIDSDQWTAFVDVGYLWEINDRQSLQVNFTYNHTTFEYRRLYVPVPVSTPYQIIVKWILWSRRLIRINSQIGSTAWSAVWQTPMRGTTFRRRSAVQFRHSPKLGMDCISNSITTPRIG